MLRALFVLLFLISDYDTASGLCHQALAVGLANSFVLFLVGFLFVVSRRWHMGERTEQPSERGVPIRVRT